MELVRDPEGNTIAGPPNIFLISSLPVDTPFGNLFLKAFKVFTRLAHANLRVAEVHQTWRELLAHPIPPDGVGMRHYFVAEEAVFMLRRAADELVGMVWLLQEQQSGRKWPTKVEVDSLGAAIADGREAFQRHLWLLETLNNVANAHKHSFVQSDWGVAGRDEPCVVALGLKYNDLDRGFQPYVVSLDELVVAFNAFLADMLAAW